MKRLALVILVVIMLTCSNGTFAENEITFRNLKWFSTKQEVDRALLADGAKNASKWNRPLNSSSALRLSIDSKSVVSFFEGIDCGYMDYYEGITVAGYEVEYLSVSYIFPLMNDQVINNADQAEFYMGYYSLLVPESSYYEEEVYDDLTRKLSYLYGEYTNVDEPQLFGSKFLAKIWKDSNNNMILLFIPDKTAMLIYYAGEANSRIDNLLYHSADSLDGL